MNIKIVNSIERKSWSDFVNTHPQGNIFQTPEMFEVYSKTKNYEPILLAALNKNDEIQAILLAVVQKEGIGIYGRFTSRAIIIDGPLFLYNDEELEKLLLLEYEKIVSRKIIYTQIRNSEYSPGLKNLLINSGYKDEQRLNILNDLSIGRDNVIKKIHKGKRGNYSKAKNKGVEFVEIKNVDLIKNSFDQIEQTYKRIGLPLADLSLFVSAFKILYPVSMIKIFAASYKAQLIGIRLILTYKGYIYDWYAGADDDYKNYYTNDFLLYNILVWGSENGFKSFNFGGAGKPGVPYGVREHKLKFGGDLIETQRYVKIHKPQLMKTGELGIKLFGYLNGLHK